MKKKFAFLGASAFSLLAPLSVFAQNPTTSQQCSGRGFDGSLVGIVCKVYQLIQIVIPVIILGAVAWFIWGIVKFMTSTDAEEKSAARSTMIHGIIGFAVILGLWGLVSLLLNTFGIGTGGGGGVEYRLPTLY